MFDQEILSIINQYKGPFVVEPIDLVEIKKELLIVSKQLTQHEIEWMKTTLNKGIRVRLFTTKRQSETNKKQLLELVKSNVRDDESDERNQKLKLFKTLGYGLQGLGTVYLIISFILHFINNPINDFNNVVRFFIPILIIYIGFVVVDGCDKRLVKNQRLNKLFELRVLKKKEFDEIIHLVIIDSKRFGIIIPDHVKFIESEELLQKILLEFDKLKVNYKENSYSLEKVMPWLYDN